MKSEDATDPKELSLQKNVLHLLFSSKRCAKCELHSNSK